jgi:hypothetical protein
MSAAREAPTRLLLTLVALAGVGCAASSSPSSMIPGMDAGTPTGSSATGTAGTTATSGTGAAGTNGAAGLPVVGVTGAAGTSSAGGAGSGTGAGGTTGAAGTSAGTAGVTGSSTDAGVGADASPDASASCNISITSLTPGTSLPGSFQLGVQPVVRAHASVAGYFGAPTPTWIWSVSFAGTVTTPAPAGDTGDTVDVQLKALGDYQISVRIAGAPQCNRLPVTATVVAPRMPAFLIRVTPPSGSRLPVRESALDSSAVASAPHTIDLAAGAASSVVSLLPKDASGFPVPSFLVVTNPATTFDLQGYTARGPFITSLVDDVMYQVLVVPDGDWAPLLVNGMPDALQQALSLTPGVAVTGTAQDGAGHAVPNARVILRAGRLPSTVGVSDAGGTFAVSARMNIFGATISPPAGLGLPEAHVPASPGIVVSPYVASLGVDMKWAKVTPAPLTITVRASAGGALVAGAQVRVESSAEVPAVGTLTVHAAGGDVALSASGTARADAVTNANGVAALGLLPPGAYHLIVAPPATTTAAVTLADVTLPAAGLARDVVMSALVSVQGTLTANGTTVSGATVSAVDRGELAPATRASSTVDAAGRYTLALSPDRTYELLVTPAAGQTFGLTVLPTFVPGTSPTAHTDAIAPGLVWNGTVVGGARPIASAIVQAFCLGPSPTCLDPSIPLAQGTTAADGTLALTLPSP